MRKWMRTRARETRNGQARQASRSGAHPPGSPSWCSGHVAIAESLVSGLRVPPLDCDGTVKPILPSRGGGWRRKHVSDTGCTLTVVDASTARHAFLIRRRSYPETFYFVALLGTARAFHPPQRERERELTHEAESPESPKVHKE